MINCLLILNGSQVLQSNSLGGMQELCFDVKSKSSSNQRTISSFFSKEPHGSKCSSSSNKSSVVKPDEDSKRNCDSLGAPTRQQSPRKRLSLSSNLSLKRKYGNDCDDISCKMLAESSSAVVHSECSTNAKKIEMLTPDPQLSKKSKHDSPSVESPEVIPVTPEEPVRKKTKAKLRKRFPFSSGHSQCDIRVECHAGNQNVMDHNDHSSCDDKILTNFLQTDHIKSDLQQFKSSLIPESYKNAHKFSRGGHRFQQSPSTVLCQISSETDIFKKFSSTSPKSYKDSSDEILASILENSPIKILHSKEEIIKQNVTGHVSRSRKRNENVLKPEFPFELELSGDDNDSKTQLSKNTNVHKFPGKKVMKDLSLPGGNIGPLSPIESANDEILNGILASISPVKSLTHSVKESPLQPKNTEKNVLFCQEKEVTKNNCGQELKGSPSKLNSFGKIPSHLNTEKESCQKHVSTCSKQSASKQLNSMQTSTSHKFLKPGSKVSHIAKNSSPLQQEKLSAPVASKYPPLFITDSCQSKAANTFDSNSAACVLKSYQVNNDLKHEHIISDTSEIPVNETNTPFTNMQTTSPRKVSPLKAIQSPLRRSPRKHHATLLADSLRHKIPGTSMCISPRKMKTHMNISELKQSSEVDAHVLLSTENKDCEDLLAMFMNDDDDMALMGKCGIDNAFSLEEAKRCEVVSIEIVKPYQEVKLMLKCPDTGARATCTVHGCWLSCPLSEGDIVTIEATWLEGQWLLNNEKGLLVLHPDTLISGTTVVGSMFCARRSVLSSMYRGMDADSPIMVIGSLVHELLQMVLQRKAKTEADVKLIVQELLGSKDCVRMLYAANMTMPLAKKELNEFVPRIVDFISTYVGEPSVGKKRSSNWLGAPLSHPKLSPVKRRQQKSQNWNGKIVGIRDIEENFWEPSLGIKGMVDVSVDVEDTASPGLKKLMPLELKTGRASFSAEHRGQVTLYTMMMSKLGPQVESGLLLYLREGSMQEIRVSHREKKDLIMLRNSLVHYLQPRSPSIDPKSGIFMPPQLPEPINFGSACEKCPYLTLCSVYLQQDDILELSPEHPMVPLSATATQHLSKDHVHYILHWAGMLQLEDMECKRAAELRHIWCLPPEKRERKGRAIVNLCIQGTVTESAGKYSHTLVRQKDRELNVLASDLRQTGLSSGDFIIVSTDSRLAVDHGSIVEISASAITLLANRDLRKRYAKDTFHLDASESSTLLVFNLTNLGCLLDDSERAKRLRQIIIEKSTPTFTAHIDKKVLEDSQSILSKLNEGQRNALLRTMQADQYLLIKGMPGTGKTATMVALVQLLVHSGQSVLVTSHTHAAVDNVLLRLKTTGLRLLRLGPDARIHANLLDCSEASVTRKCRTPEDMDRALGSAQVVGVTCLGAGHALLSRGRIFDVCLVDESTQVLQPSLLRPLLSSRRFVLVGDPNQLPPLVRSHKAQEMGLGESLFAHLDSPEATVTLSLNYRMNRVITELANSLTYNGELRCGNKEVAEATLQTVKDHIHGSTWLAVALSKDITHSVVFIDTRCMAKREAVQTVDLPGEDSTCSNMYEVDLAMQLLHAFIKGGVNAQEIGVMAPYRAQVACLTQAVETAPTMKGVEVNTVDQFQGRDKQVVIYSCTRSGGLVNQNPKKQEILNDHRRLTVAVTRAKHKLVMLGDTITLQKYAPFKKLLSCLGKDHIVSLN